MPEHPMRHDRRTTASSRAATAPRPSATRLGGRRPPATPAATTARSRGSSVADASSAADWAACRIARRQLPVRRPAGRARAARRDLEVGRQRRDGRDRARSRARPASARRGSSPRWSSGSASRRSCSPGTASSSSTARCRSVRSCRSCARCTAALDAGDARRGRRTRGRGARARCVPELHARPSAEPVAPAALFEQLLGVLERLGDRVPTLLVARRPALGRPVDARPARVPRAQPARRRGSSCSAPTGPTTCTAAIRCGPALAELDRAGAGRTHRARALRPRRGRASSSRRSSGRDPAPELVDRTFERSDGNAFFAEELLAARRRGRRRMPADAARHRARRASTRCPTTRARCCGARRSSAAAPTTGCSRRSPDSTTRGCSTRSAKPSSSRSSSPTATRSSTASGTRWCTKPSTTTCCPVSGSRCTSRVAELLAEHPGVVRRRDPAASRASWRATGTPRTTAPARWRRRSTRPGRPSSVYAYPEALAHVERALELWSQVPDAEARTGMRHVDALRYAAHAGGDGGQHRPRARLRPRRRRGGRRRRRSGDRRSGARAVGPLPLDARRRVRRDPASTATRPCGSCPTRRRPARARVLATRGPAAHARRAQPRRSRRGVRGGDRGRAGRSATRSSKGTRATRSGSALVAMGDPDEGLAQLHRRACARGAHAIVGRRRARGGERGRCAPVARALRRSAADLAGRRGCMARERGLERYFGAFLRLNACETLWIAGPVERDGGTAPRGRRRRSRSASTPSASPRRGRSCTSGAATSTRPAQYIERDKTPVGPDDGQRRSADMGSLLEGQCRAVGGRSRRARSSSPRAARIGTPCATSRRCGATRTSRSRRCCSERPRQPIWARRTTRPEFGADVRAVGRVRSVGRRRARRARHRRCAQLAAETARADGTDTAEMWTRFARDWAGHGARIHVRVRRTGERPKPRCATGDRVALRRRRGSALRPRARRSAGRGCATASSALIRRARLDVDLGDDAARRRRPTRSDRARARRARARRAKAARTVRSRRRCSSRPKTASVHVSNILAKLGVANRGEAAAEAHRLGLDRVDTPA